VLEAQDILQFPSASARETYFGHRLRVWLFWFLTFFRACSRDKSRARRQRAGHRHQEIFEIMAGLQATFSHLLDAPWGLQLGRLAEGGNYHTWDVPEQAQPFWTTSYRVEALIDLRQLLDITMVPETFDKITQPTLVLYYYKSEKEQDLIVSVDAMKEMFTELSTQDHLKKMEAIPEGGQHVFVSKYYRKDIDDVRDKVFEFAESVLQFKPAD